VEGVTEGDDPTVALEMLAPFVMRSFMNGYDFGHSL
jgi:hypothetical protein